VIQNELLKISRRLYHAPLPNQTIIATPKVGIFFQSLNILSKNADYNDHEYFSLTDHF
jgi:hypothetical protein